MSMLKGMNYVKKKEKKNLNGVIKEKFWEKNLVAPSK